MSLEQTGIIAVPELEVVRRAKRDASRFCPSNDFAGRSRTLLDSREQPTLYTARLEQGSRNKRTFPTPVAPLAQRILRGLPRDGEMVFPGLTSRKRMIANIRRAGGPDKFIFNVLRHTASTFLQNAGHSQWERDLILNHVGCGTTSDYSHGHALALKGELLREWADHIQGLVTPAGAVRLR
jgi:integrase